MFLSTMQTLPNQIPMGPAEMISLLSFSVEWGFLFLLNMYGHLKVKVTMLHLDLSNIVCEYEVNPY